MSIWTTCYRQHSVCVIDSKGRLAQNSAAAGTRHSVIANFLYPYTNTTSDVDWLVQNYLMAIQTPHDLLDTINRMSFWYSEHEYTFLLHTEYATFAQQQQQDSSRPASNIERCMELFHPLDYIESCDAYMVKMQEPSPRISVSLTDTTMGLITAHAPPSNNFLYVDTGASTHIICDERCLINLEQHVQTMLGIKTGNGISYAKSRGPAAFLVVDDKGREYELIREVVFVPSFSVNLFSPATDWKSHSTRV